MPLFRRLYLGAHEDIRAIARNTTFFTVPGTLPSFPLPVKTERTATAAANVQRWCVASDG